MYTPACSPVVAKYIAASIKSGPLGYINRHRQQGPNMWCVVWYSFILSFGAIHISSEAGLWLWFGKLSCQGLISKVILPAPGHEPVEMVVKLVDAITRIQAMTYVYLLLESNRCSICRAWHMVGRNKLGEQEVGESLNINALIYLFILFPRLGIMILLSIPCALKLVAQAVGDQMVQSQRLLIHNHDYKKFMVKIAKFEALIVTRSQP